MLPIGGRNSEITPIPISDVELISVQENNGNTADCDPLDLPFPVADHASVMIEEGILTCGGTTTSTATNTSTSNGTTSISLTSNCNILAAFGGIRSFPPMISDGRDFKMVLVNDVVYALGKNSSERSMETIHVKNATHWTQESLPINVSDSCVVTMSNKIFVIGGNDLETGDVSKICLLNQ